MENIKNNPLIKQKGCGWQTFVIALATAAVIFVPFMIYDGGYFLFYGDFNVQQIPFYRMCHDAVQKGEIYWNWATDLGTNFIASYSFYLLGSPFFWLTLIFPSSFVPYMMGPLLILKFACAAFTSYLYLKRFVYRPQAAMIGGLMYAFSGFSVYNVFFNHFHEAIIFFPLLLLAVEVFITENRRGWLALAVFICCLSNYFFFFGMVVFVIIYWFVRMLMKRWKFSVKSFLCMILECVLGVGMTLAVLYPTYLVVMASSRVKNYLCGWGGILYGKEQIFLNIIQCFFFPPDLPARPVFFPGADVKWSSLGGWMPLFSMTGVIGFMQAKKKNWLKTLSCILIFMAMVPILNSSFYMFNYSYYARWFYMPVLMFVLATVSSIEDTEIDWNRAWRWCFIITLAFTLVIGHFPTKQQDGKFTEFGLYTNASMSPAKYVLQWINKLFFDHSVETPEFGMYDMRFWITCLIALLSLICLRVLIPLIKRRKDTLYKAAVPMVCVISIVYSIFFIANGKSHSYDSKDVMRDQLINGSVDLPGCDNARIDTYDCVDNTGMFLGYSTINTFHSIVPVSITDFWKFVGEERVVASRPSTDSAAARNLLSVKYLLNRQDGDDFTDEFGNTKMDGYKFVKSENGFDIYENTDYIPMGFTYEYYMTREQALAYGEKKADDMMLKAIMLDDKQIIKYGRYLTALSEDYNIGNGKTDPEKSSIKLDAATQAEDCKKLAATSAITFEKSDRGFRTVVKLESENLVFFSVPYEDGWEAYVNGQPVSVEKVNEGFMAVFAGAGESTIEFIYTTPGLEAGLYASIICAGLLIIYLIVVTVIREKCGGRKVPEYPERAELEEKFQKHLEDYCDSSEDDNEDDFYSEITTGKDEYYSGMTGGFKIDDSVLESGSDFYIARKTVKKSDFDSVENCDEPLNDTDDGENN